MRYLILLLLFINTAMAESAPELVDADMAVMKIDKNPILYTDFQKFMKDLNSFRCLFNDSEALKSLRLDHKNVDKLPALRMSKSTFGKNRDFMIKLVKLIKTQVYSSQFKLSVDGSEIRVLEKKKCLKGKFSTWSQDVRSLILVEFYLRERFLGQNRENVKQDISAFIDSIDKKITHDLYF